MSQTCGRFIVESTGDPEVMKWVQDPAPDKDFVAKVQEVTGGRGVASYGWPTGDPGSVPLMTLRSKGSLFVTRPTVTQYTAEAEDFRAGAAALFGLIKERTLRIKVGNADPLRDAALAHADLVAGKTLGCAALLPHH